MLDGTKEIALCEDSRYIPNVIDPSWIERLVKEVEFLPRESLPFKIYGRTLLLPRDKQFYGDVNPDGTFPLYRYGGNFVPPVLPWTPCLKEIRDIVRGRFGGLYNHTVVNRYVTGEDYIGYHRDKNKDFVTDSSVITVSLGTPRPFYLRNDKTKEVVKVLLDPGSVFVLGPVTNKLWKHSIPKKTDVGEMRISVTIRCIKTIYDPKTQTIV